MQPPPTSNILKYLSIKKAPTLALHEFDLTYHLILHKAFPSGPLLTRKNRIWVTRVRLTAKFLSSLKTNLKWGSQVSPRDWKPQEIDRASNCLMMKTLPNPIFSCGSQNSQVRWVTQSGLLSLYLLRRQGADTTECGAQRPRNNRGTRLPSEMRQVTERKMNIYSKSKSPRENLPSRVLFLFRTCLCILYPMELAAIIQWCILSTLGINLPMAFQWISI